MIKKAIKFSFYILIMSSFVVGESSSSDAESQDSCAIWLCLPGGFPQGCGGAHSEFKKRIKKGKSPLPALSSCSSGSNGNYTLGYEVFKPCKEGYSLQTSGKVNRLGFNSDLKGVCYSNQCLNNTGSITLYNRGCTHYSASKRAKPSFVKMWVDGEYLGQFFY